MQNQSQRTKTDSDCQVPEQRVPDLLTSRALLRPDAAHPAGDTVQSVAYIATSLYDMLSEVAFRPGVG